MPSLFRAIALGLLLTGAQAQAQETKLGHIDRAQLVKQMPEHAAARTKLETFANTLETRLKAMADEYRTKRAVMENPPASMSRTERDMALRELQDLEQRIMDAQEKAEEDLAKMEQELMQPVIAKADEAIRAVAGEQAFTYVLDSSAGLMLFQNGTDLMAPVKAKLGIK